MYDEAVERGDTFQLDVILAGSGGKHLFSVAFKCAFPEQSAFSRAFLLLTHSRHAIAGLADPVLWLPSCQPVCHCITNPTDKQADIGICTRCSLWVAEPYSFSLSNSLKEHFAFLVEMGPGSAWGLLS